MKDSAYNLAKECPVSASYLSYAGLTRSQGTLSLDCFSFSTCRLCFLSQVSRSTRAASSGLFLHFSSFSVGFRALVLPHSLTNFWPHTDLSPSLLHPPPPPSLFFSLSFSPCHHLFSITLISGWLRLETFQEFLIENTMRTVITSVSPGRELVAWGG